MQLLHARCYGLDVHKKTVVACILITPEEGKVQTFSTMTSGLLALDDWLATHDVTQVAMESTGVYTPPPILPRLCKGGTMSLRSCVPTFAPEWVIHSSGLF